MWLSERILRSCEERFDSRERDMMTLGSQSRRGSGPTDGRSEDVALSGTEESDTNHARAATRWHPSPAADWAQVELLGAVLTDHVQAPPEHGQSLRSMSMTTS